jgi:hypothetical protein
MNFKRIKKTKAANWISAFPEQRKQPTSESYQGCQHRSEIGGMRERVYQGIAKMFLELHRFCQPCKEQNDIRRSQDVHHMRGREGLLLSDVRYFLPVCRQHHGWIEANKEDARKKGWQADQGDFRRQD